MVALEKQRLKLFGNKQRKGANMKYINCPVCKKQLLQFYCVNVMLDDIAANITKPADRYEFWCDDCDIEIDVTVPREPKVRVIK